MSTHEAREIGLLGVPSSAGSHNAGQDETPGAWRAAGIVQRLTDRGFTVHDHGDLPRSRHRPAARVDGVRDLERVVGVAGAVAERVESIVAAGRLPMILGGDCTITLGVVAGLARSTNPGLLYFDGDADLNTPDRSGSGVLDTMGMTHFLGGGRPELSGLGPRTPLVPDDQVALFGFDPAELDTEQWSTLVSRQLLAYPVPAVRADPGATAARAWNALAQRVDNIVLHFDVDVLDTGAFPLANFPHFNGLRLDEARSCLEIFEARPELAALVVTEVNPTHDPDGRLLPALVEVLTSALISPR